MIRNQKDHDQAIQRASELKISMEAELLRKPNVVGVGVGLRHKDGEFTEEVALIVMVSKKVPEVELAPEDKIPEEIDNVPIDVLEVGELFAGGTP
jgi:hypothetical protein